MILAFIGWLIDARKVGASTIEKYLSGLRIVHLKNGYLPGNLRPELARGILRVIHRPKPRRKPQDYP